MSEPLLKDGSRGGGGDLRACLVSTASLVCQHMCVAMIRGAVAVCYSEALTYKIPEDTKHIVKTWGVDQFRVII